MAAARKPRARADARGTIRWDRVGRVALLGTLGVILLLYISPAKHWLEQARTARHQKQELQDPQGGERHGSKRASAACATPPRSSGRRGGWAWCAKGSAAT